MQLYSDVPFLRKLVVVFKHSFALAIWLHLKRKKQKKQLFSIDWHIQYSALKLSYLELFSSAVFNDMKCVSHCNSMTPCMINENKLQL